MNTCLYCRGLGPFTTVEHVIPESLGNDDLILEGCVCDKCQRYFGEKVESFVLLKTPIAYWRTLLGVKTKKGRYPTVDMSQPKLAKGALPDMHKRHDNIAYTAHPDGTTSVDIQDDLIVRGIRDGSKSHFELVLTPKKLNMLGRFLGKVGLGILAVSELTQVYDHKYDRIRQYARYGDLNELWPIFHFTEGKLGKWKKPSLLGPKGEVFIENVECYSYEIVDVEGQYMLFRFSMGLDNWIISLNDPYPTTTIRSAFPERELQLIWYSPEELSSTGSKRQSKG